MTAAVRPAAAHVVREDGQDPSSMLKVLRATGGECLDALRVVKESYPGSRLEEIPGAIEWAQEVLREAAGDVPEPADCNELRERLDELSAIDPGFAREAFGSMKSLFVAGDLDLSGMDVERLPNQMVIAGALDLSGCDLLECLPRELEVNLDLCLHGCSALKSLPPKLRVQWGLDLRGCTSWDGVLLREMLGEDDDVRIKTDAYPDGIDVKIMDEQELWSKISDRDVREIAPSSVIDVEATLIALLATNATLVDALTMVKHGITPELWRASRPMILVRLTEWLKREAQNSATAEWAMDGGDVVSALGPALRELSAFDPDLAQEAFLGCGAMQVKGSLDLSKMGDLRSMPDWMEVEHCLLLDGCSNLETLPRGLKVGHSLEVSMCSSLKSLPERMEVGNDLLMPFCIGWDGVVPADAKIGRTLVLPGVGGGVSLAQWRAREAR